MGKINDLYRKIVGFYNRDLESALKNNDTKIIELYMSLMPVSGHNTEKEELRKLIAEYNKPTKKETPKKSEKKTTAPEPIVTPKVEEPIEEKVVEETVEEVVEEKVEPSTAEVEVDE